MSHEFPELPTCEHPLAATLRKPSRFQVAGFNERSNNLHGCTARLLQTKLHGGLTRYSDEVLLLAAFRHCLFQLLGQGDPEKDGQLSYSHDRSQNRDNYTEFPRDTPVTSPRCRTIYGIRRALLNVTWISRNSAALGPPVVEVPAVDIDTTLKNYSNYKHRHSTILAYTRRPRSTLGNRTIWKQ